MTTSRAIVITSDRGTAADPGRLIRGRRGVGNGRHRRLDVTFHGDGNRARDKDAGANPGMARRVAASLLKQDQGRGSIKAKRFNAALDEHYLLRTLQRSTADQMRWP